MSDSPTLTDEALVAAIAERRERLEQLEERFFYIAENSELAAQIAGVQQEIDALRQSLDAVHRSPADRIADEISVATAELERLEERFFYIAENSELAAQIAGVQAHIDELKTQQQTSPDR